MRVTALLLTVLSLTACGGPEEPVSGIQIEGAWARPSLPPHDRASAYLLLHNASDVDDALISVDVDAARVSELHTMETDEEGGMRMSRVERFELPAGGTHRLEAGGDHLMFFELARPWVEGEAVSLFLTFAESPGIVLKVPIRPAE